MCGVRWFNVLDSFKYSVADKNRKQFFTFSLQNPISHVIQLHLMKNREIEMWTWDGRDQRLEIGTFWADVIECNPLISFHWSIFVTKKWWALCILWVLQCQQWSKTNTTGQKRKKNWYERDNRQRNLIEIDYIRIAFDNNIQSFEKYFSVVHWKQLQKIQQIIIT